MKAFYMAAFGGPEVMKYGELPDPTPGSGQVLVEVKATSLNPLDWKLRAGAFRMVQGSRLPKVLGSDVAGVVKALGPGVTGFKPGDAVYGTCRIFIGKPGAQAQLVAAEASQLRHKPEWLTFEQAAALPVAALTALAGLRPCGNLAGKNVLVNGATGGVGHFALQVAKARGARVTAVCSGRNAELARSLGADEVIDYAGEDFTQAGKSYDVIFDAHGLLGLNKVAPVLAPKGFYANPLPGPRLMLQSLWGRLTRGQQAVPTNLRNLPEDYAELEDLLRNKGVKPVIEQVFPLERAAEGFAVAEGGKARGKVVLQVAG